MSYNDDIVMYDLLLIEIIHFLVFLSYKSYYTTHLNCININLTLN